MQRRPSGLGLTTRDHNCGRTGGDQVVAAALTLTLPVLLFVALLILSVCGRPILTTDGSGAEERTSRC